MLVAAVAQYNGVCRAADAPPPAVAGKPAGACAAADMQPLAFWLGHWDVYADGKLDGHDFVESTLAGCAVLEDSTLAVGDVGIASGFDSRASFMRVIKRQLGQPASAIRRAARRDAAL